MFFVLHNLDVILLYLRYKWSVGPCAFNKCIYVMYEMKSLSKFAIALPCLLLRSILRRIISLMPYLSATTLYSPPSDCSRVAPQIQPTV